MTQIAVSCDKFCKGLPNDLDDAEMRRFEVLDLVDALGKTWTTDAHLVTYIVPHTARMPRVNKDGEDKLRTLGFEAPVTTCFVADVDNPGHARWTTESLALFREEIASRLETEGVYVTQHGYRLMQPLKTPIPRRFAEPYIQRWLNDMTLRGHRVDMVCKDSTRLFRLPHVYRDGLLYRSPLIFLENMHAIDPPPLAPDAFDDPSRASTKKVERAAWFHRLGRRLCRAVSNTKWPRLPRRSA